MPQGNMGTEEESEVRDCFKKFGKYLDSYLSICTGIDDKDFPGIHMRGQKDAYLDEDLFT